MASILPHRPPTNGTSHSSSSGIDRQASLTSFPSSRTPSSNSTQSVIPHVLVPARDRRNHSSTSMHTPPYPALQTPFTNGFTALSTRKVRSQYPTDSSERHVEYILVASFDIDRGPTMEHQYPGAISGDENMLAELMLPDQAHVRNQDWTIFFLHKDTGDEEAAAQERRLRRKRRTQARADAENEGIERLSIDGDPDDDQGDNDEEEEPEGGEGPPLIYVLNLVNTKQDTAAKRC